MTNNQLKAIVDRIERLEQDKAEIANDIKEVYAEAKSNGFDPKILKKVISLRKVELSKRKEEQALIATYMESLGDLANTPLGQAAIKRASNQPSVDDDDDDDDF